MNYLHYALAAIEKPETPLQAAVIFMDWLNQVGVTIHPEVQALEGPVSYRDYLINNHGEVEKYSVKDQLNAYINIITSWLGVSWIHFVGDAMEDIFYRGYMPDVRKLAVRLVGEPDLNLLRLFLDYHKEVDRSGTADVYYFVKNLRKLIQVYGKDYIVNLSRNNPDELNKILYFIQKNTFSISELIDEGVEFSLLERIAKEFDYIDSYGKDDDEDDDEDEYERDYELDHWIAVELAQEYDTYNEGDENFYSLEDVKSINKSRIANYAKDTKRMVESTEFDEAYQRLINHDQTLLQDEKTQKDFLFYYKKLKSIKLKTFEDYHQLKETHDKAARYYMLLRHAQRALLNEPLSQESSFPPPVIQPVPPLITYIDNEYDLEYEGAVMGHCVGSYTELCQEGRSYIYKYENGDSRGTIEVSPSGKIEQFYGPKNKAMSKEDEEIVEEWVNGTLDLMSHNIKVDTPYRGTDSKGRQYEVDDLFNDQEGFEYRPNLAQFQEEEQDEELRNAGVKNLLRLSSREWFRLTELF